MGMFGGWIGQQVSKVEQAVSKPVTAVTNVVNPFVDVVAGKESLGGALDKSSVATVNVMTLGVAPDQNVAIRNVAAAAVAAMAGGELIGPVFGGEAAATTVAAGATTTAGTVATTAGAVAVTHPSLLESALNTAVAAAAAAGVQAITPQQQSPVQAQRPVLQQSQSSFLGGVDPVILIGAAAIVALII